jgi:hypothetical protein
MTDEEGILYAELDLEDLVLPKQFHDLSGYMNRFDIFNLTVDRSTNDAVHFEVPRGRRDYINRDMTEDFSDKWSGTMAAE